MEIWAGGLLCILAGMSMLLNERLPITAPRGKWQAFGIGTALTALVQSSSAVSCSVCALAEQGTVELGIAYALLIGSNVGTTLTPFLIAVGVGSGYSLAFAVIGLCSFLLRGRLRKFRAPICGLSLMLWGTTMLSAGVKSLDSLWKFADITLRSPVTAWLAGILLTAIFQSSAVTIGILQAACLSFPVTEAMVVPFLLGQNIGTTATAWLAAGGGGPMARKCAAFHTKFNLVGSLWGLPVFWLFRDYFAAPAGPMFVAVAQLVFNLTNALLFILFAPNLHKKKRPTR